MQCMTAYLLKILIQNQDQILSILYKIVSQYIQTSTHYSHTPLPLNTVHHNINTSEILTTAAQLKNATPKFPS